MDYFSLRLLLVSLCVASFCAAVDPLPPTWTLKTVAGGGDSACLAADQDPICWLTAAVTKAKFKATGANIKAKKVNIVYLDTTPQVIPGIRFDVDSGSDQAPEAVFSQFGSEVDINVIAVTIPNGGSTNTVPACKLGLFIVPLATDADESNEDYRIEELLPKLGSTPNAITITAGSHIAFPSIAIDQTKSKIVNTKRGYAFIVTAVDNPAAKACVAVLNADAVALVAGLKAPTIDFTVSKQAAAVAPVIPDAFKDKWKQSLKLSSFYCDRLINGNSPCNKAGVATPATTIADFGACAVALTQTKPSCLGRIINTLNIDPLTGRFLPVEIITGAGGGAVTHHLSSVVLEKVSGGNEKITDPAPVTASKWIVPELQITATPQATKSMQTSLLLDVSSRPPAALTTPPTNEQLKAGGAYKIKAKYSGVLATLRPVINDFPTAVQVDRLELLAMPTTVGKKYETVDRTRTATVKLMSFVRPKYVKERDHVDAQKKWEGEKYVIKATTDKAMCPAVLTATSLEADSAKIILFETQLGAKLSCEFSIKGSISLQKTIKLDGSFISLTRNLGDLDSDSNLGAVVAFSFGDVTDFSKSPFPVYVSAVTFKAATNLDKPTLRIIRKALPTGGFPFSFTDDEAIATVRETNAVSHEHRYQTEISRSIILPLENKGKNLVFLETLEKNVSDATFFRPVDAPGEISDVTIELASQPFKAKLDRTNVIGNWAPFVYSVEAANAGCLPDVNRYCKSLMNRQELEQCLFQIVPIAGCKVTVDASTYFKQVYRGETLTTGTGAGVPGVVPLATLILGDAPLSILGREFSVRNVKFGSPNAATPCPGSLKYFAPAPAPLKDADGIAVLGGEVVAGSAELEITIPVPNVGTSPFDKKQLMFVPNVAAACGVSYVFPRVTYSTGSPLLPLQPTPVVYTSDSGGTCNPSTFLGNFKEIETYLSRARSDTCKATVTATYARPNPSKPYPRGNDKLPVFDLPPARTLFDKEFKVTKISLSQPITGCMGPFFLKKFTLDDNSAEPAYALDTVVTVPAQKQFTVTTPNALKNLFTTQYVIAPKNSVHTPDCLIDEYVVTVTAVSAATDFKKIVPLKLTVADEVLKIVEGWKDDLVRLKEIAGCEAAQKDGILPEFYDRTKLKNLEGCEIKVTKKVRLAIPVDPPINAKGMLVLPVNPIALESPNSYPKFFKLTGIELGPGVLAVDGPCFDNPKVGIVKQADSETLSTKAVTFIGELRKEGGFVVDPGVSSFGPPATGETYLQIQGRCPSISAPEYVILTLEAVEKFKTTRGDPKTERLMRQKIQVQPLEKSCVVSTQFATDPTTIAKKLSPTCTYEIELKVTSTQLQSRDGNDNAFNLKLDYNNKGILTGLSPLSDTHAYQIKAFTVGSVAFPACANYTIVAYSEPKRTNPVTIGVFKATISPGKEVLVTEGRILFTENSPYITVQPGTDCAGASTSPIPADNRVLDSIVLTMVPRTPTLQYKVVVGQTCIVTETCHTSLMDTEAKATDCGLKLPGCDYTIQHRYTYPVSEKPPVVNSLTTKAGVPTVIFSSTPKTGVKLTALERKAAFVGCGKITPSYAVIGTIPPVWIPLIADAAGVADGPTFVVDPVKAEAVSRLPKFAVSFKVETDETTCLAKLETLTLVYSGDAVKATAATKAPVVVNPGQTPTSIKLVKTPYKLTTTADKCTNDCKDKLDFDAVDACTRANALTGCKYTFEAVFKGADVPLANTGKIIAYVLLPRGSSAFEGDWTVKSVSVKGGALETSCTFSLVEAGVTLGSDSNLTLPIQSEVVLKADLIGKNSDEVAVKAGDTKFTPTLGKDTLVYLKASSGACLKQVPLELTVIGHATREPATTLDATKDSYSLTHKITVGTCQLDDDSCKAVIADARYEECVAKIKGTCEVTIQTNMTFSGGSTYLWPLIVSPNTKSPVLLVGSLPHLSVSATATLDSVKIPAIAPNSNKWAVYVETDVANLNVSTSTTRKLIMDPADRTAGITVTAPKTAVTLSKGFAIFPLLETSSSATSTAPLNWTIPPGSNPPTIGISWKKSIDVKPDDPNFPQALLTAATPCTANNPLTLDVLTGCQGDTEKKISISYEVMPSLIVKFSEKAQPTFRIGSTLPDGLKLDEVAEASFALFPESAEANCKKFDVYANVAIGPPTKLGNKVNTAPVTVQTPVAVTSLPLQDYLNSNYAIVPDAACTTPLKPTKVTIGFKVKVTEDKKTEPKNDPVTAAPSTKKGSVGMLAGLVILGLITIFV